MAARRQKTWIITGILVAVATLAFLGLRYRTQVNWNPFRTVGEPLDSLDGVVVYYNGGTSQSHGRNTAADGYNIGLRYQCVEFVKRYYLEHFGHRFPDAYGHARDFFDPHVADGKRNPARNLIQYRNPATNLPRKGDILVWGPSRWNPYGHVAIVSKVQEGTVEYIQQNAGPFGPTRATVSAAMEGNRYRLTDAGILGWLGRQ
jgi:surface antigen